MRRTEALTAEPEFPPGLFEEFKGQSLEEICTGLGVELRTGQKAYTRDAVKGMANQAGLDGRCVLKAVRVGRSMQCEESMSLPVFRYCDLVEQSWRESDLCNLLSRPFVFFVFQSGDQRSQTRFVGAVVRRFTDKQLESARAVWEDTACKIEDGDFDSFILESETDMVFVRCHARNGADMQPAPDGSMHIKRSFWISKRFIESEVLSRLRQTASNT